jgi:hypothetical protein
MTQFDEKLLAEIADITQSDTWQDAEKTNRICEALGITIKWERKYDFQGDIDKRDKKDATTLRTAWTNISVTCQGHIMLIPRFWGPRYTQDSLATAVQWINRYGTYSRVTTSTFHNYYSQLPPVDLVQVHRRLKREPLDHYSLFTAIQKYDVGTFQNFCSDFGYPYDDIRLARAAYNEDGEDSGLSFSDFCSGYGYCEDAPNIIDTYNAVCKEYKQYCKFIMAFVEYPIIVTFLESIS